MKTLARFFAACALPLVFVTLVRSQSVSLDFETTGQFSDNFRGVALPGGTAAQTSNGAANDFVRHDRTTGTNAGVAYLYDTTPGDTTPATQSVFSTGSPVTVSFDLFAAPSGSSFGVYFADPSNPGNNVLALFTANTGNDSFAFFRDGTISSGSLTAGTQIGTTTTVATTIEAGTTFTTGGGFSVTLSFVGATPTLSLTAGGQTVSKSFSAGDVDWTNTVVILRLFDNNASVGSGVGVDNFTISAIPEPAHAATVLALGAVCFAAVRRRRA